ncbi:Nudix family hydrolase [Pelistega sp. NLN82]|uniref:8-oxo-dGTP diphosphatase n=1 Tax=Pelistega ratti TaxID=2652177 RepID=A0A6L9Y800_9BURK|nr:Nudix family hydrolase [Pelistega ratti]NEN76509.1 Nudix family hydrolase [Pelistega ratti]
MSNKPYLRVAVGVILKGNQVLLTQRPEGKPWAGWWEFPGGKIEKDESIHQALARELKEELGISIDQSYPWVSFVYEYPTTIVELHFRKTYAWQGDIKGLEKQAFAWTTPQQAHELGDLLPASLTPLKWLQLPDRYAITHFQQIENEAVYWEKLNRLIASGIQLFQFREPLWTDGIGSSSLHHLFEKTRQKCHEHGVKLLINSRHPRSWWALADGVQLRAEDAVQLDERPIPEDKLLGISCHTLADILYAHQLKADFIILGHVGATASHPNQAPLGWEQFSALAIEAGRPVFAIGGQTSQTLAQAKTYGAHGVAILSGE